MKVAQPPCTLATTHLWNPPGDQRELAMNWTLHDAAASCSITRRCISFPLRTQCSMAYNLQARSAPHNTLLTLTERVTTTDWQPHAIYMRPDNKHYHWLVMSTSERIAACRYDCTTCSLREYQAGIDSRCHEGWSHFDLAGGFGTAAAAALGAVGTLDDLGANL